MGTVTTVTTRTAAAPPAVWTVLADLDAWADWLPTVDRIEAEQEGEPPRVGAAYRIRQPKLPPARWTVTDWCPEERFTWRSRSPGLTATADHRLRPTGDGGTEVVLTMTWAGPFAPVVGLLYGGITRRYMQTEAAELAERSQAIG
jgi:hypothetical protein